jgi:hypothetical protein
VPAHEGTPKTGESEAVVGSNLGELGEGTLCNERGDRREENRLQAWLSLLLAITLSFSLPPALLTSGTSSSNTIAPDLGAGPPTPVATTSPSSVPASASGTSLLPGTVRSVFSPIVSPVASRGTEPSLVRSRGAYTFVTSFGNYTFPVNSPYVMSYNSTDGSSMVTWSAFLVGVATGSVVTPWSRQT